MVDTQEKVKKQSTGISMPFMMIYTHPTQIQEATPELQFFIYNPNSQTMPITAREVGTKCLKSTMKDNKGGGSASPDNKNEIDDSKYVG
jgi:hypothetical protein